MSKKPAPALSLAKPCPKTWGELVGDDRRRYCGACDKHVYNLEALEPDELVELIRETEGRFCGRLVRRRRELTVMTDDCPVGRRRDRARKVGGVAFVAAASLAGLAGAARERLGGIEAAARPTIEVPAEALGGLRPAAPDEPGHAPAPPEPEYELGEMAPVELLGDVAPTPNAADPAESE